MSGGLEGLAGDRRLASALALTALTLAALGLRLLGLDHLLPQRPEMDAQVVMQLRALVERGGWSPAEPGYNDYPTLMARLAALPPLPRLPGPAVGPEDLAGHLAAASRYHTRVRLLVVLFSAGLIPAVYLLARSFTGRAGALVAAGLAAVDPIHLLLSTQARPHGVLTTLALVAVLAAMRLRRRPDLWSYALAGLSAALAIGALHSGIAVLIPLCVAHLTREKRAGSAPARRILLPATIVALGLAWFYRDIYLALSTSAGAAQSPGEVVQGGHRISLGMFDGSGFAHIASIAFGTNPVLAALACAGALLLLAQAIRTRRWIRPASDAAVALSFALPYFVVIGVYGQPVERFLLPLLPYAAVIASLFLARCAATIQALLGPRASVVALASGALATLALPAATSVRLAWLRTRPDTYEQAAATLAKSLPAGAIALLQPGLDLPLYYERESVFEAGSGRARLPTLWPMYQATAVLESPAGVEHRIRPLRFKWMDPLYSAPGPVERMLNETGAEVVVLEVSGFFRDRRDAAIFLTAVERWGVLARRFRPDDFDEAYDRRLTFMYTPGFLERVSTARALGPELRIYRRRTLPRLGAAAVEPEQGD